MIRLQDVQPVLRRRPGNAAVGCQDRKILCLPGARRAQPDEGLEQVNFVHPRGDGPVRGCATADHGVDVLWQFGVIRFLTECGLVDGVTA